MEAWEYASIPPLLYTENQAKQGTMDLGYVADELETEGKLGS